MLFIFSLWSCTLVHFLLHCGFVPLYEACFGTKQCRALTRTKEVAWHPSNRYGVSSVDWPLACREINFTLYTIGLFLEVAEFISQNSMPMAQIHAGLKRSMLWLWHAKIQDEEALHTTRPLLGQSCIIRMEYTLFSIEYEMMLVILNCLDSLCNNYRMIVLHILSLKNVPCFSQVIETCLGEREMMWEHGPTARVSSAFRVLPNFHKCFFNSVETWRICFQFLLENTRDYQTVVNKINSLTIFCTIISDYINSLC